jgi:DNA-binding CsgD family transcriptional regulator/PAS domain-containing protein
MGQEEITLGLIGLIYDAAGDPAKWPAFLEKFAEAMRGTATSIIVYDAQRKDGNMATSVHFDPVWHQKYEEYYVKADLWGIHGDRLLTQGSVRLGQELCPNELLAKSEFCNDFLKPMNTFHEICGVVVRRGSALSVFSSLKSKSAGPFGEEEARLFRTLMPHLQRGLQLHRRVVGLETDALTATSTLDHLHIGLIRLDRDGRVLAMNRAAQRIIAQRDGLTATRDGLQAVRADETRRLRIFISEASLRSEGMGFGSGGALPISRPSLKRPLSVLVSPAPSTGLQLPGVHGTAVVFVTDPEAAIESDEEILKRLFGLTASEARIASLLVQGRDLNEICGKLSIRRTTARTHLRHLFEKLGVRRQGELISLLLRTVGAVRVIQHPK